MKNRVVFKFACSCGCGQLSDELGKDYIRLLKNEKWYANKCEPDTSKKRPFKNGYIIKKDEF